MADTFEQLIDEIRQELDQITGGQWPADRCAIGHVRTTSRNRAPRIEWSEGDGGIEPAEVIGGTRATVATDTQQYRVSIWHRSTADCRATLHNLIVATRNVAYGPNSEFGDYEWAPDGNVESGRRLTVNVTLRIPVFNTPQETAPVETYSYTTSPDVE